ncbi:MAG: nucleotide sugar dehydrogenase [bacterium]
MKLKVSVIGLGYVGLPVITSIAKTKKYNVVGFDLSEKKIEQIQTHKSPSVDEISDKYLNKNKFNISSDDLIMKDSDIFIVCVPTPVDEKYIPDYSPLVNSVKSICKYIKKGNSVIIESTINPGTCEEVVLPTILSNSKLNSIEDFTLAHCPERINPGDLKWNIYNIPRNLGSSSKEGTKYLANFYRTFIKAPINEVSSIKVAESTKIIENTFRDINIAYVNELAMSFDKMEIDLVETIKAASNKPFAFMPHWPGCGVGGHCIAVDPYYLIERAAKSGFDHKFLKTARSVNNGMPKYTVEKLYTELEKLSKKKKFNVTVLGLSYKGNVGDLRESPALVILELLKENKQISTSVFDPYVSQMSTFKNLKDSVKNADAVLVCTNHSEFKDIVPSKLFKNSTVKVVIDGRNIWKKDLFKSTNIVYKGIGQ